MVINRSLY